ncbi:MAG: altronate dehydratase, partial [Rhodospirillales bacterium]|nr:altronate dehydratase [Rhodospirillales bacterium]
GEERAIHDRILIGHGRNPNCAAALVISLEPESARRLEEGIAETGIPVETVSTVETGGGPRTEDQGRRIAIALARRIAMQKREPCALADLVVGLKCGGSDPTSGIGANVVVGRFSDRFVAAGGTVILSETIDLVGGEHILARRAATPEIAQRIVELVHDMEEQAAALGGGLTNLYEDHIAAGLTTPEEKSLGSLHKGGSSSLQEVLDYGASPTKKGLVYMDALGGGIAEVTGVAAAGAQIILFTTGGGHPTGNPVAPTIKITANPKVARSHADVIDIDAGSIFDGRIDPGVHAEHLWNVVREVAEGRTTRCEESGDTEITVAGPMAVAHHLTFSN